MRAEMGHLSIPRLPLGGRNWLVTYFWQWLGIFLPTPDRVISNRWGFSTSSHGLNACSTIYYVVLIYSGRKTHLVHQSLKRWFGGPLRSNIPAYLVASTKTAYHPRLGAYHPMLPYIWAKPCLCILFLPFNHLGYLQNLNQCGWK